MIKRCHNPNHRSYCRYGARGITACERWQEFGNFLDDMGERPDGTTLDRIENSKGYEPDNCRWVTSREQAFNKRRTVLSLDRRLALAQKAEELGSKSDAARWAVSEFGCAYRSAFNVLMPKKLAADATLRQQVRERECC